MTKTTINPDLFTEGRWMGVVDVYDTLVTEILPVEIEVFALPDGPSFRMLKEVEFDILKDGKGPFWYVLFADPKGEKWLFKVYIAQHLTRSNRFILK